MVAWWLSRSLCIPESEGTITLYNTQFKGFCRSSLTSELIWESWNWWNHPMDSGHMEGSCFCTLLMNYVGCIITEPHIFSSVSDAPKNSLALILEIIKLTNHVLLCKIIYLLYQCRNPSIEKHSKSWKFIFRQILGSLLWKLLQATHFMMKKGKS